jgi:hypothetical protein
VVSHRLKATDFCSLDIEGAEFPVLKTIPWDKVSSYDYSREQGEFSGLQYSMGRGDFSGLQYSLGRGEFSKLFPLGPKVSSQDNSLEQWEYSGLFPGPR